MVSGNKESSGSSAYDCKASNDGPVIPRLGLTAPLEGEEKGSDGAERENRAKPIERLPLLEVGHAPVGGGFDWIMRRKPDGDGSNGDGAKGKIDVEAPAPGKMVCKGPTEEWTDDAGEGEDTAEATEEKGAVLEAGYLADDGEDRDEDAGCADALNGAGKDEDVDGGTEGADETAEFEDCDCEEVEIFCFCDGEELAECEHEAGLGD